MKIGFNILIVDDEVDMRDSLSELLSREGYSVQEAENGKVALELMGSNKFDLIVSDILMPEMDGVALLKKVKESDSEAVVILITGSYSTGY